MSVVEQTLVLTDAEARKVTTSIQLLLDSAQSTLDRLEEKVIIAYEGRADLALGYASWSEYAEAEFREKARYLPSAERREFTIKLAAHGMSTRAIAPVVGVSQQAVSKLTTKLSPDDVSGFRTPAPIDVTPELPPRDDDWSSAPVNPVTGEVLPEDAVVTETHTVKVTTGLDGKTYTQTPRPERRRSLVDDAFKANTDLWKAIERIRTIRGDDRFTRNKADILAALQPSVDLALETLQGLFPLTESE